MKSLPSKNAIERVENVKSLGFYSRLCLVPKPHPKASLEASNRPKQAQHLSTCRKVQNGNTRVHQGLSDSRGMSVVYRFIRHLPSHPHPPKLKEVPKVLPQVMDVPVHLPSLRASHGPTGLYSDCKKSEADGPDKGNQTSSVPGRLAYQSQEEAQVNTQTVVDLTQSLGWIINQEKFELKLKVFSSFVGYEYHLASALVKPTQERWYKLQDLILQLKSKHVLTARCLMSLIGLLASTEMMVPEGRLHMRPFQFHLKEHWRYPQSLDTLLPWTETISAHLEWWQNPTNVMKGADLHQKDHSIQLFTDASNEGWGAHLGRSLRASLYKGSVVRQGKKATHKCSRTEGGFSGSAKFQGPVPKPNSVGCYGQLNSSSLHKQTRKNPLCGDVRSPVEDHDVVPSLPDNIKSQTHSRMSECYGRPSVQVNPSPANRMVTASTGVQTDLSQVVHPSCRSICHSSEPQSSTMCPRPKCLGHRCSENWSGLTAYAYLPTALLHRVIQKIRQCNCLMFIPHVDLFATRLNHKIPLYVSQTQMLGI